MAKILIVEDDAAMAAMIRDWLSKRGHLVEIAHSGKDARDYLYLSCFDLIIIDWMLPDEPGIELCREYRSKHAAPILMLTARNHIADKETGFGAGADDYLTKPFQIRELAARVEALLRRPLTYKPQVLQVAGIQLDPARHSVTFNGEQIHLHPKEFAVLELLMLRPGQVFSADQLFKRVWPTESEAGTNALTVTIKRLRQKLGDEKNKVIIKTVRGYGYKINDRDSLLNM